MRSSDSYSHVPLSSTISCSTETSIHVLSKLKESIEDTLCSNIPVEDFVHHVWKLSYTDINRILDRHWKLSQPHLKQYKKCFDQTNYESANNGEGDILITFSNLSTALMNEIRAALGYDHPSPVSFKCIDNKVKGDLPYIATVWNHHPTVLQTIFAFKNAGRFRKNSNCGLFFPSSSSPITHHQSSCTSTRSSPSSMSREQYSSSLSGSLSSCGTSITTESDSSNRSTGSRKRKRSDSRGSDPASQVSKRSRSDNVSDSELKLARKAQKWMNSSNRLYMTTSYVDSCTMTLWYYDRMSAIRSCSFNFERDPAYLALVLHALCQCDYFDAGFDRFLDIPRETLIPRNTLQNKTITIHTLQGSTHFRITRDSPIYVSRHELIGRGTIVYPVQLLSDEDEQPQPEEQVLKIYWPTSSDPQEADIIHHLRNEVPEIVNHLPCISFFTSFTAHDMDLPSTKLRSPQHNNSDTENRILHMFAMKRYEKLWQVASVDEFKNVFLDCVECHFLAYRKGRVLHRDLSENNLMIWRSKDASAAKRAWGILNDWDMSSCVPRYRGVATVMTMMTNPSVATEVESLNNRTGTLPFMALDLLTDDDPPRHLYRHDLESFLWILIWAAVHYDIPNKKNYSTTGDGIDKELKTWDEGTRREVRTSKRRLLRKVSSDLYNERGSILDRIRPEFRRIKAEWIIPLLRMFACGYDELQYSAADEETCGGIITFETFMSTMSQSSRLVPERQEHGWNCIVA